MTSESTLVFKLCSLEHTVWLRQYAQLSPPMTNYFSLPTEMSLNELFPHHSLKCLLKWSSLPHLPAQGMLPRAIKNSLKLVPSPSPFQHNMEIVFQNESLKKIPVASRAMLVTSWEGERDTQTFPQPLWLLISLWEAPDTRFCPSCHTLSWTSLAQFIYLFSPILEQPANDFTPFCLAAKSNTITPLRVASVGSKNKMDSFPC